MCAVIKLHLESVTFFVLCQLFVWLGSVDGFKNCHYSFKFDVTDWFLIIATYWSAVLMQEFPTASAYQWGIYSQTFTDTCVHAVAALNSLFFQPLTQTFPAAGPLRTWSKIAEEQLYFSKEGKRLCHLCFSCPLLRWSLHSSTLFSVCLQSQIKFLLQVWLL